MDYKNATVEELANFVEVSPASRITQQLIYYRKAANAEMVEKILQARILVKKRKLKRQLDALG